MFEKLCAGHEMEILLLIVILVISIGKGAGVLLLQLLKKMIGREELTINVGAHDRESMAGDRQAMAQDREAMSVDRAILAGQPCLIPENCPKHGEENLRSLQNQKDIDAMKSESKAFRDMIWKELKATRKGVTCIVNGLLAKQIIDPRDIPWED